MQLKISNALYFATGGMLVFTFAISLFFLFRAMSPTADVFIDPNADGYLVNVQNFEPGQKRWFQLGDAPIVIWRRSFKQKVQALEQLGIAANGNAKLIDEIKSSAEIEVESGLVVHLEWFVVSPINTGGYRCNVLPGAGTFDGFFDPCRGVHFDLWGRVRSGPTKKDLVIPPWVISGDEKHILVNVSDAPKAR